MAVYNLQTTLCVAIIYFVNSNRSDANHTSRWRPATLFSTLLPGKTSTLFFSFFSFATLLARTYSKSVNLGRISYDIDSSDVVSRYTLYSRENGRVFGGVVVRGGRTFRGTRPRADRKPLGRPPSHDFGSTVTHGVQTTLLPKNSVWRAA